MIGTPTTPPDPIAALREAYTRLRADMQRIAEATPANTNRFHATSMASWTRAVARTCLEDTDAAAQALAGGGWQPIETAPRDGGPVLGWDPYYLMRVMRPDTTSGSWLTDLPFDAPRGGRELRCEPTHWLPLPQPPAPPEGSAS